MKLLNTFFIAASTLGLINIYSFKLKSLEGDMIDLSKYKGKKILIVNTASKCGLTPQYAELEKLYKQYEGKLVIIGCPANDFKQQEPGNNKEIAEFCEKNYGVSFLMTEKITVTGSSMHPLYKHLSKEAAKKGFQNPVIWNFGKFLINEKGRLIATYSPKTSPLAPEIIEMLK